MVTIDDTEPGEWEEWNMEVTFTWTYVNEGPFPEDMDDETRAEGVEDEFWANAWEHFYNAYTGATLETQLETGDPVKYERNDD